MASKILCLTIRLAYIYIYDIEHSLAFREPKHTHYAMSHHMRGA